MIGQTISHYKIIEKLGEGGMGIVYKAKDFNLDRFVALKFLPTHMGKDDAQKQRFIVEAKAASALDHPNICTIYEIDETESDTGKQQFTQIFIAMACYDGQTLKEKIAIDAPMTVTDAISIITQLAQGLQKAHEKDIVHRDIKPANIVVTNEGDVKIVDFGLAKLKGQTKLTKEDTTLGTIAYMSPEQAKGEEIDAQTDIWSLGITFYEMLTGKTPFIADYDQAVVYNILHEIPEPVNNLNNDISPELDHVVQKCLEKDKDKRYQTIKEFLSDLVQVIKKHNYTIKTRSGEFQLAGVAAKKSKLWPTISVALALIVVSVIIARLGFGPEGQFSSYEEAFFKTHYEESRNIIINDRSLDDVKAHRYYIRSIAFTNQDEIPEQTKQEYRDLLAQNPESPQANYYLGLVYSISAANLSERDSVWILYEKAEDLGLNNLYLKLEELIFYKHNNFTQQATEVVTDLLMEYPDNPNVMFQIGFFYYTASDTSKAREYWENTLDLYGDYLPAHLGLFELSLNKNDIHSAKVHLEKADEINSNNIRVVQRKAKLFEKEGRFDAAEECLNTAISSFGTNDIRLYKLLAGLYQKQDLFEQCDQLIAAASENFPDELYFSNLKSSLEERKKWIKIHEEHKKDKNYVTWSEDYESSMEKAAREKKPIIIEFYTTSSFMSRDLEENTYPDPRVQDRLKSYIPLRINGEIHEGLANKYKVNWYPAHVIINENGEKLDAVRYYMEAPGPLAFIKVMNEGLALYAKYAEGAYIENQQITEVTNIDDAIILSKSKQVPVLVLVFSKESKWSNKLLNETLNNPSLQPDLKKVILVKVDRAVNKKLIKKWDITYFPTILFLDDSGETLYQIQGYQPATVLANLIEDMNAVMSNDTKFKERITWLYNLEEAKSFAVLQNKDIFVFVNADWCPHCVRTIDNVFPNPYVIETINDKFVAVFLDDERDPELLNSLGIRSFPTFLMLDASQAEIIRLIGYHSTSELMPVLDLEDRKPIYSILGQDKYQKFYNYESLADQFYRKNLYLSAIQALQKQIDIFPDYWKSYYHIGNAYLDLNKPRKTVSYYTKAIGKGAEINQKFAENMLSAYLQLNDVPGFEKWFQNITKTKKEHENETVILYDVCSEYYEIIKERKSAILVAEQALEFYPDNLAALIRLGRLYYLENRFDEAIYHLTKAVQINKNDPRPCFYLGLIADRKGDAKEKERYFDLARQRSDRAANQVGRRRFYKYHPGYYLYPGYPDLIEQGYRYYLELDDDVAVKNDFAYFLAVESRNLDEALQLVEDVLEEMPENAVVLDTKAVILYQQGEYQKAHETVLQYEKRITKEDLEEDPSLSYYMGRIKWAVGDTVSAKYYFNFTLKQTNPDAKGRSNQEELKIFMAENSF